MPNNGIIRQGYDFIKLTSVSEPDFQSSLQKMGFVNYVTPDNIESKKGKNIIVISLESFERGFINDSSYLTPSLDSLKKAWSYFDMEPNPGSSWTSGSLYTYMTGMPAFFDILQYNSVFQSTCHSNIASVSNVLNKANYDITFMIDNAQFSGTDALLFAIGINHIIDKTLFPKTIRLDSDRSKWNVAKVNDKDLFDRLKFELKNEKESKNPFSYFISTINTHGPRGIYDKQMEEFVPKQETELNFNITATDYLVGDLINFLEEENLLENTSIYIFPDHMMMGGVVDFSEENQGLFLISNVAKNKLSINDSSAIYQIDLAKTILEGAEIEHNAKFLSDYISGDKLKFIKNNINLITALNVSGLQRYEESNTYIINTDTSNFSNYANDTSRFIAHAGGMIDGLIYTNSIEALDENYKNGFRLFELDISLTSDNHFVAVHDWGSWINATGYSGNLPPTLEEFYKHKFKDRYTLMGIKEINDWFHRHTDAILITDKVNTPALFGNKFTDKSRLKMELFTYEAVIEALSQNIQPIASQQIIGSYKGDIVKKLKSLGIYDVAISRNFISRNTALLKRFKAESIRVYAFNIHDFTGRNEEYVIKTEMDYIYGIYADQWDFNSK